jgi:hypothetical protein
LLPPTKEDLEKALYRYKGWALDVKKNIWGYPEKPLYDKMFYKEKYINHIKDVHNYFNNRSNDFIEINVSRKEDFKKLCEFLCVTTKMKEFPWENKT